MRFKLPDGEVVEGETYEGIVSSMAAFKLERCSNRAYRRSSTQRLANMHGVIIDSSTDQSYVLSLKAAGLLTEL